MSSPVDPNDLTVEERYQEASEAERYHRHHGGNEGPTLRSRLEIRFCDGVLGRYGPFESILDCPSGVGRFWPMLSRHTKKLHGADVSGPMIEKAKSLSKDIVIASTHVAPAQRLPFDSGSIDAVFCHRLLHHFGDDGVRREILAELARVARRYVFFSAWAEGNLRAVRARRRAKRRGTRPTRFHVPVRTLISAAEAAGLEIVSIHHKLRFWSPVVLIAARKKP